MPDKLIPSVAREDVATPADVVRILTLSPEQVVELRLEQEKALKVFKSRARLNPKERQMGYAIEMERHHRKTGNVNALAEALAAQGRFAEAAETAAREDLKTLFREKLEAIHRHDADCSCPTYTEENGQYIPNQYIESEVISPKHGDKLMPAIRCRVCGTLNVRTILPHLAEQRAARRDEKYNSTDFFQEKR